MNEFAKRRKSVYGMMKDNSLLIEFSNQTHESIYEVNRNFYYLTSINEYNDILVISKKNNQYEEYFFKTPYDELLEKWVGKPLSLDEIKTKSEINNIFENTFFDEFINNNISNYENIYLDINPIEYTTRTAKEEEYKKNIEQKYNKEVINSIDIFKKLRTIKSDIEIKNIIKANEITNFGIKAILNNLNPNIMEYQIESYFDQAIKYNGATNYSFKTIAATGVNATCLHYTLNNTMIKDGDLVLFDLGASYNMYCADISRTFPANGKFSDRQKILYQIVLDAQKIVMDNAKIGITTKELNELVKKFYAIKLKEIGLIKNDDEVLKYYYHGVSHHLGLDCHDLCEYTALEAGSVISNEPGLYIKEEGIGIRIEDNILITNDQAINLSEGIIKEIIDIEKYMEKRIK